MKDRPVIQELTAEQQEQLLKRKFTDLTAEQQAALLKTKDKALGKLGEAEGDESGTVVWDEKVADRQHLSGADSSKGSPGSVAHAGIFSQADAPHADFSHQQAAGQPADHEASRPVGSAVAHAASPLSQPVVPGSADAVAHSAGLSGQVGSVASAVPHPAGAAAVSRTMPTAASSASGQAAAAHTSGSGAGVPATPPLHIQGTVSGAVTEDSQLDSSGTLSVTGGAPGAHQWALGTPTGHYGTLDLGQDGQWHYHLDSSLPAVQALGAGQQVTERFLAFVTDAQGQTQLAQIVVNVHGTNDGAVITGSHADQVTEDQKLIASGKLDVTDVDTGEAHFQAGDITGQHGTLHLAADGQWTYDLDNAAAQKLGAGEMATDTLTVRSADGTTQQITITLHGTNDQAVIGGTAVGTVTEDTLTAFSGKLDITDVDNGEAAVQPISHGAGQHGEFVVAADGSWTYTLSPTDGAVQALRPGDAPLTDTITVTSKDGSTTQTLTVYIQGTNDAPTLQATSQQTHEDDPLLHGQLIGHDVDSTDILVYGTTQAVPGFTLHADGSYDFDPSNTAYQHLAPGAQEFINIPVTVTDQAGARSTETLQIVVTGTNDAPLMMTVPPMATFEGSAVIHNRLFAIDLDDHEVLTFRATAPVAGFTLNPDGSYTFDPSDPAYDHLPFGQPQVISIPVEVVDASGASAQRTLEITVTGTNDVPTLGVTPMRHVAEGAGVVNGQLTATDPDTGDTLSYSLAQHIPGLTLDADGQYHFDPADAHYNYLGAGQKAIVTVPVIVTDQHGGSNGGLLQITVTGTNDVPIVAGIDHAVGSVAAAQGGRVVISHQLAVLDLDQGEGHFQAQLLTGTYGVLEIKEDGTWTYTADARQPAIVSLPADGHLPEQFTVRTADGTTHTIDLQIKGANAPAIIAGVSADHIDEDQTGTIRQHLSIIDPNAGEAAFQPVDQVTQYGHFTLAANGDWTYQLDNSNPDVQALVAGKTLTDSILVGSVDGTPKVLSVTIQGTNDVAVIGGTHTGDVIEDNVGTGTTLHTEGQLVVTDPDANQEHFIAMQGIPGDHGYGTFSIDAQGHWTYTADNSAPKVQALQGGHQATDSIEVMTADGTRQTITVTLAGTNDAAVITENSPGNPVKEDTLTRGSAYSQASGKLEVTDTDQGENHFKAEFHGVSDSGYGGFIVAPTGAWIYRLDNNNPAVQALGEGEPLTDTFTAYSADGTAHTVTVHIVGTNDQPTISTTLSVQGTEDQDITLGTADFGFHDVDASDTLHHVTLTQLPDGATQGQFLLNGQAVTAGQQIDATDIPHLVFRPVANFNGDVAFGYKVSDGHVDSAAATGTLHVASVNDAPTTPAASLSGTEDTVYTFSAANFGFSDADAGDTLQHVTVTGLPTAAQGQLLLNGHAVTAGQQIAAADIPHLSFQPAANFNGDVAFKYTVSDGHADSAETTGTLHVASVNDAPTVTAVDATHAANLGAAFAGASQTFTEAQLLSLVHAADVDHDTLAISAVNIDPAIGSFTRAASGDWTFHPAGTAHGDHLPVTLTVSDGTATTTAHAEVAVRSTLTGVTGSVKEDAATTVITGDLSSTSGGTLHLGDHTMAGHFGNLDLRDQGHWVYTLNNNADAVQGLKEGETRTETFTIQGPNGPADITITLTGTHDAPLIQVTPPAPADIRQVAQVAEFTGATDLSMYTSAHEGVPVGTRIVGLYLPGDSHNLLASIAHGDLPVTAANYNTGNLAAAGAGYIYLAQHQWFGQHLDGGPARYAPLAPSIRNNFDGGLVVFEDGTVGQLVKVCDDDRPGGPGDYIYLNKLVGVNANTGISVLSGTAGAGDSVQVVEGYLVLGTTTADAQGHWQLGVPKLSDGHHSIHTVVNHMVTDSVDVQVSGNQADVRMPNPILGQTTEDDAAHQTLSGQMHVTDADTGDHPVFTAQSHTAGHYGSFAVDAQGHWTYTLDNSRAATNELAAGQTRTETFTVEVTTDSGEHVSQTVTVNVTGTNDAPVITSAVSSASGAVTEDAATTTATGTLAATDADAGAHLTWSVAQTAGTYGHLAIDPATGQWTYTLDNSRAATQGLTSGHPGSETFTVTVTDEHGATATQTVTIGVTGTNDGAVITETGTQSGVTEDTSVLTSTIQGQTHHSLTCMGQLAVTDADQGEATFAAAHGQSSAGLGSFAILPNGSWTYAADNDNPTIQALPAGRQITDSFEVHSADGTTHTVTVTITGSNDAPTVTSTAGSATGAVTEDAATTTATGTLVATDVDAGAHLTWSIAQTAGTYGNLAIDPSTGQWTYTLDNSRPATQALNVNDHQTETFTATVTDEHGAATTQTITLQVTGTDDAATVIDMGSHVADLARANLEAAGMVRATDVDSAAPHIVEQTATQGQFGQLSVNAQGIWRFQLDPSLPASQALASGQTDHDTFTVRFSDGTTHDIVIDIRGTSQGPQVVNNVVDLGAGVSDQPQTFTEATLLSLFGATNPGGGSLTVSDVHINAQYGSFAHNPDGSWTFTPAQGVSGNDIPLTISVTDGTATTSGAGVIDITPPPNTAPTVTADATHVANLGATAEDTAKTFTEADLLQLVGAADADAGNVLHVGSVAVDPKFGAFSKDAVTGDWTFTPAADFHGDQVPLTIAVTDGTTSTDAHAKLAVTAVDDVLTVAADGSHPAPMPDIAVNTETTFTKAQLLQLVGAADPDGDALSITEVHIDPRAGYFAPQPNGDFIFKPAANFHADDLDITLKVTDGTSTVEAHAQLDIKATPGQLAITTVDNALHTTSSFETTSTDLAIHGTAVGLPDGTPITLHLADKNHPENTFDLHTTVTGGAWSLSFDQSQVLVDGNHDWAVTAHATDLFGTAVDASTEVLYQDTPTASAQHGTAATSLDLLSGSVAGTAVQHVQYSSDGGQSWSDQVPAGFTLAADGHTLQVDPTSSAFSSLAHGQQQQVQVQYEMAQAADPSAGTIHQTASVTITGSNHGPTVTAVDAAHAANLGATTEDTAKTFTDADLIRMVGGSDADHDALHVAAVRISPEYGSFAHDAASGSWTFTPAANYDGSHLPISIEVTDGSATATGHAMIDITPVADTPVLGISLGAVQMSAALGAPSDTAVMRSPGAAYGPHIATDFGDMIGTGAHLIPEDQACVDDLKAVMIMGHLFQVTGIEDTPEGRAAVLDLGGDRNNAFLFSDHPGQEVTFIFKDDAAHSDPQHASTSWSLKFYNVPGQPVGEDYVNEQAGWTGWTDPQAGYREGTITNRQGPPSDSHFTASIPEDTGVELHITLSDPDTSEHLALQVAGLPQGATLSAGTHNADGSWTLSPDQLPGLIMTPPADFSGDIHLAVTATSTDHTLTADKLMQLDITVDPVAEKPALSVMNLADSMEHSGAVALDIDVNVHHDAGETLSITIQDLPSGATLSAGTHNADGSWTLTPAELQGLKLTPDVNWSGSYALKVTATAMEATGETTTTTRYVGGTVHSVLDMTVSMQDVTTSAGTEFQLPIQIGSQTDSGEQFLSARIELPSADWVVYVAHAFYQVKAADGSNADPQNPHAGGPFHVDIPPQYVGDLSQVDIQAPPGFHGDAQLRLTAEITDDGTHHPIDLPFTVTVSDPGQAHFAGDLAGTTADDDSSVSGQLIVTDPDAGENHLIAQTDTAGHYGKFSVSADGQWTYTPDDRADAIAAGDSHPEVFTVTSADGTTHDVTITVTGSNEGPSVSATTADLGATLEDTAKTFSEADLLQLVGAHDDAAGAVMHIGAVTVDPQYGAFSKQGSDWVFTPTANFDGSHLPVTVQVTDGTATATAHAALDITPVADTPTLSVALGAVSAGAAAASSTPQLSSTAELTWKDGSSLTHDELTFDSNFFDDIDRWGISPYGGVDPTLITGMRIDGQDVAGAPQVITDIGGVPLVTFAGLTPAALEGAQRIEVIFGGPTDASVRCCLVPHVVAADMWSPGSANTDFFLDRGAGGAGSAAQAVSSDLYEDHDVPLVITATSPDGSETLSVTLSGLPAGATLSAGTDNHDGSWTLTPAQLPGLALTPPQDFSGTIPLHVSVTSTDGTESASTATDLQLTIHPEAEQPTLTVADLSSHEDAGAIALNIGLQLDIDPSETPSIVISGLVQGATLSAGVHNADDTWTLTPAQLQGLTLTAPDQYAGTLHLTVTATSTEASGESATQTAYLAIHVDPVLDMSMSAHDLTVSPQQAGGIALPLDYSGLGVDSSEALGTDFALTLPSADWRVEVNGLGTGQTGTDIHLLGSQLANAVLIPPPGFTGDADIRLTGSLVDGTLSSPVDLPFTVHVQPPPAPAPAPAPQADENAGDQPIDTADTLVADDGSAVGQTPHDALAVASADDLVHHDTVAPTGTDHSVAADVTQHVDPIPHVEPVTHDAVHEMAAADSHGMPETENVVNVDTQHQDPLAGYMQFADHAASAALTNESAVVTDDDGGGTYVHDMIGVEPAMDPAHHDTVAITGADHSAAADVTQHADPVPHVEPDSHGMPGTENVVNVDIQHQDPLAGYMQFADHAASAALTNDSALHDTPLDSYLTAAGVDHADLSAAAATAPTPEELGTLDLHHDQPLTDTAAHPDSTHDDTTVAVADASALGLHDDPTHHNV
ncbi:MAG: VCBS domain-containing protein [Trichlorobacter sp.]|uniref:VCBS domain-containing protein n=1 Tax=Trichlorobacter sp. TaxID=2911007 RepID=UPI00256285D7|nr:VCBS domain-containing protein [Trichlorobacter sp.]MDK9716592.1 VCBS domain-containing protein [Trichlorobacter sp.]